MGPGVRASGGGGGVRASSSAALHYHPSASENPLCMREERKCTRDRVDGQPFCARHLPPEHDSAYRRCNYVSTRANRRCPNILLRSDAGKEAFCLEHAKLVTHVRRQAAHRSRYRDTLESVALSLRHYGKFAADQSRTPRDDAPKTAQNRPPRAPLGPSALGRARPTRASDCYSESSDDDEAQTGVGLLAKTVDDEEVDVDDSVDPLKHAGTYTVEEIVTIARDKLVRLQALYNEYFKVLQQKYRLNHAEFVGEFRREQDCLVGVEGGTSTYRREKKGRQLRALRRYRRRFGVNELLRMEQRRRRRSNAGLTDAQTVQRSCKYVCAPSTDKPSQACDEVALPKAQFCVQHIYMDGAQLLFSKCSREDCGCSALTAIGNGFCWLHNPLPEQWPKAENEASGDAPATEEKASPADNASTASASTGNGRASITAPLTPPKLRDENANSPSVSLND